MTRTLALALLLISCNNASTDGSGPGGTDDTAPGDTDSSNNQGTTANSDIVDPDCVDGQYSEVLPDPSVSIASDLNSYASSQFEQFLYTVLEAISAGQYILWEGYQAQGGFPDNCIDYFINGTSSGEKIISQASTLVHECGHFLDLATGGWGDSGYHFTQDLLFVCPDGSTPDNGGGKTFSRSLINTDEFSDLHPPCTLYSGNDCDSYAYIYLNGNPNDSQFDSGDQGFNMLHEETLQYVHSLATGYTFNDYYSGSVSERDGILTFLWYTMRYLRMARLEYPQTYTLLSQNDCWRELTLSTWGRAWLYLDATESYNQLGINDTFIETLVREPVLLDEIQRLRDIEGCD